MYCAVLPYIVCVCTVQLTIAPGKLARYFKIIEVYSDTETRIETTKSLPEVYLDSRQFIFNPIPAGGGSI